MRVNKYKKSIFKFLTVVCLSLLIIGCNKDDILEPELIDFNINISLDESIGEATPQNVIVKLTNTTTGDTFETLTNESGIALFDNLEQGSYNATANLTWTKEEFETYLGYSTDTDEIIFSGAQENINVSIDLTTTDILLQSGKIGNLLIKQVYYAGSDLADGASFRDQFIEIYNNSNEEIYVDGLLIAQTYGRTSTSVQDYSLDNGQYDWTQSSSNTVGSDANNNYVYCDFVYKIPGSGTEYPLASGESIIIAQSAVNHKSPLTDNDGNAVSVTNPDLTVDLSNADFEGYLGDYKLANGDDVWSTDIQNVNVPDLEIIYFKSGNEMIFHTSGADSFIIFNHDDAASLPLYQRPGSTSATQFYMQVPIANVVDAVELNKADPTNLYPRQLPVSIDGGYASIPDGAFSSQSVIRKVEKEVNGRKILFDTNNSSTDFSYLTIADPKGFLE